VPLLVFYVDVHSELVQQKLNIWASVGESTPPKWKSEHPLIEVGVSELINFIILAHLRRVWDETACFPRQ